MSAYTKSADRSVYGAEDELEWALGVSQSHGSVVINGVPLTLEPETNLDSLEAVQAYVNRVVANPAVIARFGRTTPVTVRPRKTAHAAHYQNNVIAIHPQAYGQMRETTVLHELAHHHDRGHGHGPSFAATEVALLGLVMGPQISLALRILFDQHDVPVG